MAAPLLDRVRAALSPHGVTEQKMFGGVCFMRNGNMLAGASPRGLLLRVGKDGAAAALARPHARPMEMRGRPMAGYIYVDDEGTRRDADLRRWLEVALAFVDTLPPKAKSNAAPGKRRTAR